MGMKKKPHSCSSSFLMLQSFPVRLSTPNSNVPQGNLFAFPTAQSLTSLSLLIFVLLSGCQLKSPTGTKTWDPLEPIEEGSVSI